MMNGNASPSAAPSQKFSFFSRLFNIVPTQWPRVTECWLITFFFKVGSGIGWTVLTAAFVSRFGIHFLPTLFVLNAMLIMGSTFFFERFIMRMKREVLMILMLLLGALCLLFAAATYERNPVAFFTLVIFAESVFLAQFNVFIPILVGDRFTPLESQKTFPFIESGETIGGIVGGAVVGLLGARIPVGWFMYLWIAFLVCAIFVFAFASYVRTNLPPLPFRIRSPHNEKAKDQIKLIFRSIQQFPFLKSLVLIVFFQWVFMNVLEFQYTKAIEQSVTHTQESTVANKIDATTLRASVLSSPAGVSGPRVENPAPSTTVSSTVDQAALTQKLGAWKGFSHAAALLIQVILASRLITSLGIVGAMILQPVIMLMSLVGMFLKFGLFSSVIAKVNFETTLVVHKNAYFSSHYAFPKFIRDQAAEFLEGIVRPMGTIIGMLFILSFQLFMGGKDLSIWIHGFMFLVMAVMLFFTIRLSKKYTSISRNQLFSSLPYPEKLNAIEVLAQRGHDDSSAILVQKLANSQNESPIVRMKILSALGKFHDYEALPQILESLSDPDPDVRLEAANALMNFHDIGEKFYTQAFSRFRMIETLKVVFRTEKSASVRSAIIRLFSLLRQSDIIAYLLDVLREQQADVQADCIYTLGLFKDPNAAYYILPYLDSLSPKVRANALVALWQFSRYRPLLEDHLNQLLKSSDPEMLKAGIFAIGEMDVSRKRALLELVASQNPEIQLEAAFALMKTGDVSGFEILLHRFLTVPNEEFDVLRRFFHRLKPKVKERVEQLLAHFISHQLTVIMKEHGEKALHEVDQPILEKLRRLYTLLDQHEELYVLESALARQALAAAAQ